MTEPVVPDAHAVCAGECDACPARASGLFSRIAVQRRAQIASRLKIIRFAAKDVVFRAAEQATHACILRFGLVKEVAWSISGEERIVRLARPGDSVGLEAALGERYRHTAVAMSDVEVCRVPAAVLVTEEREDPPFLEALMRHFQANLEQADLFLTEMSVGTATQRVARLLLYLVEPHDHDEVPMIGREEMGTLLGLTTETVSRTVAGLRRAGLIRAAGRPRVVACDVAGLARIAQS